MKNFLYSLFIVICVGVTIFSLQYELKPTRKSHVIVYHRSFKPKTFEKIVQQSPEPQNDESLSVFFNNKNGCFLLYDITDKKLITQYNPTRCAKRISPDSTFKIPLSVMAFDQKLIDQSSIFIWDKTDYGIADWNNDQTPKTWMTYSTVWVSQYLTPKLGKQKIKNYLKLFSYGNQDFSGDITEAWLDDSLKISANEELAFLVALDQYHFPVSKYAVDKTLQNTYLETSPNGWKLYGKTGSGSASNVELQRENGWFVGFITKDKHTYVFVLNFSDTKKPETAESAGIRAKEITKEILHQLEVF